MTDNDAYAADLLADVASAIGDRLALRQSSQEIAAAALGVVVKALREQAAAWEAADLLDAAAWIEGTL